MTFPPSPPYRQAASHIIIAEVGKECHSCSQAVIKESHMEAIREIREVTSDTVSVKIPEAFRKRRIEIIILPLEQSAESGAGSDSAWPPGYFEQVVGSAPDFPDVEYEGDFEARKLLE
jgi:hypothetical protein